MVKINKPEGCRGPSRCIQCCHWPTEQRDLLNAVKTWEICLKKQMLHKLILTDTTPTTTTATTNNKCYCCNTGSSDQISRLLLCRTNQTSIVF